ncbi:hypothetical protein L1887_18145 [Cichorium endivia]|nr:hypothetical protein L1887_18145 [Cichorium endivia]
MSEWGLQNFPTSFVELHLNGENSGVVSFAVADDVRNATTPSSSFLLPPSLVSLRLSGFTDVESFSEFGSIKIDNKFVVVEKGSMEERQIR